MKKNYVFFIFNLLQDVNILRPLIFMMAREPKLSTGLILTADFLNRDSSGVWQKELIEMSRLCLVDIYVCMDNLTFLHVLHNKNGCLVAGSESNLSGHRGTHELFSISPRNFVKITLQHGFECVGFHHNKAHDEKYGENVRFGADIICGWAPVSKMRSLSDSEKSKYVFTGPTGVLQLEGYNNQAYNYGMICENMHSVRMSDGRTVNTFLVIFNRYCETLKSLDRQLALRPHPGGQYSIKNKTPLNSNVVIHNDPIYKTALSGYKYGISAPSSVIIDMVFANIPVGVWIDSEGLIDFDNYKGLFSVQTVSDWVKFSEDAVINKKHYLDLQNQFLLESGILTNPSQVYNNYRNLIIENCVSHSNFLSLARRNPDFCDDGNSRVDDESYRVLFLAISHLPTLDIAFLEPIIEVNTSKKVDYYLITEAELKNKFGSEVNSGVAVEWLKSKLEDFSPNIIVSVRYSGPLYNVFYNWSNRNRVPLVFCIDDDLMNVPIELGERKYKMHNSPKRTEAIRFFLDNSDLIYTSTKVLENRLRRLTCNKKFFTGSLFSAGKIIKQAVDRKVKKIGYMGFDHSHDLDSILPALVRYLDDYKEVSFELFGTIAKPKALDRFGSRIRMIPPVRGYREFMSKFAQLNWDIGICPLAYTQFNRYKTNIKWIEYTSLGIATIATRNMIYDDCCSNDCGLLASSLDDWYSNLSSLTSNAKKRYKIVKNAQNRLLDEYSHENLSAQIHAMFSDVISTKNNFKYISSSNN